MGGWGCKDDTVAADDTHALVEECLSDRMV